MQTISLAATDGVSLEADLYPGGARAVVLLHGKVFDKESWADTARGLSGRGLTVLVPNFRGYGGSGEGEAPAGYDADVAGACAALRDRNAASVSILGASMGAIAAAKAVSEAMAGEIDRLVLMAPRAMARPEALRAAEVHFIVSRDESCFEDVAGFHAAAPDPKELHVFPGEAHAQFLFGSEHGPELSALLHRILADPR